MAGCERCRSLLNGLGWAVYLTVGTMLVLALLSGCGGDAIRLGPGDCVVLAERNQVIVAGSGCEMKKLYR